MSNARRSVWLRPFTLLGLCSWLVGCTSWVAMEEPYGESMAEASHVRLVTTTGEQLQLRDARVAGDSVVGFEETYFGSGQIPVAVSLDQIQSMDRRTADKAGTSFVLFPVLASALIVAGIAIAQPCIGFCYE